MASIVPLTLEMLDSPEVGERVLWLMTHTQQWVHRRVESVQFRDNSTVWRKVSIDFTVLDIMPEMTLCKPYRLVPLTVLNKRRLANFSLRDEEGKSVSLLNAAQNTAVSTAVLVAAAASALEGDKPSVSAGLHEALSSIAGARTLEEVDNALARRENLVGRELNASSEFTHIADMLAQGFMVILLVDNEPGTRRIMKFSYEEPVNFSALPLQDIVLAALGWIPRRVRFPTPAVDAPESFHFEVGAPEGVTITEGALIVTRPQVNESQREEPPPIDWAPGGLSRVHLHPRGVPSGSSGEAQVALRASRRGWLASACFTMGVIAILLTVGGLWLWRVSSGIWPMPKIGADPVLALLLTAPAILSALLVRPGEHALAGRLLLGVRILLLLIGLMMYGAAAAFVASPFNKSLMRFWLWLAMPAILMAAAASISFLWPTIKRKDPRGQQATL
jgi:hypothetical protein